MSISPIIALDSIKVTNQIFVSYELSYDMGRQVVVLGLTLNTQTQKLQVAVFVKSI